MGNYNMKGSILVPNSDLDAERRQQSIDASTNNIGQKLEGPPGPPQDGNQEWMASVKDLVSMLLAQVADFKAHQEAHRTQADNISNLKIDVEDLKKRKQPYLTWIGMAVATMLSVWGICYSVTTSVTSRVDELTKWSSAADDSMETIRHKIGIVENDLQKVGKEMSGGVTAAGAQRDMGPQASTTAQSAGTSPQAGPNR